MPITHSFGDFVAWFRGEVVRTVTWGGDPSKPVTVDPETGVLNPRHSFAVWREQVRGQSRPWHPAELAIAAELRRTVASALLRQAEARLAHLGLHDALTGLPNRRLLGERLDRVARRAADRTRGAALLFLDVDRFKTINDSLGHDVGDRLLLQVAERLTGMLRPTDTVARLGGDEFVVLCEDTPAAEALTLAERVVAEFRRPFRVAGRSYYVTVSGGLAVAPGRPSHQLMRDADVAMYQAKRRGGNQVVVFDESLRAVVTRRLELEQDLHRALRRDEVTLVYQPVVRLADGRLVGVEALARWTHPTAGAIPPAEFIVLAEETGLIVPLGARILEEAIIQAAGWPRSGAADEAPTLAINLSVRQLIDPDLPATIERLLSASGLEPGRLCLEVTETGLMTDPELLGGTLEQLRRRGVGLAIDDFGTGYSSLAYLRRLPVTQLKIAQEFVGRLGGEGPDEALVAAVVALAHTLGLTTVAEGVETAAQADRLRELGCDLAQGYHFARPLPATDLAPLLADPGRWIPA
jgi:diguanylate cyclase (GGDEF)-like protein